MKQRSGIICLCHLHQSAAAGFSMYHRCAIMPCVHGPAPERRRQHTCSPVIASTFQSQALFNCKHLLANLSIREGQLDEPSTMSPLCASYVAQIAPHPQPSLPTRRGTAALPFRETAAQPYAFQAMSSSETLHTPSSATEDQARLDLSKPLVPAHPNVSAHL